MLWYTTPVSNSWLNGASRCKLGNDAEAAISELVEVWRTLGVSVMWHQTPSSEPPNLDEHLMRHGFEPEHEPGMALTFNRALEPPPSELAVSAVTDQAGVFEWANTFDPAFGAEPRGQHHPWLRPFSALYLGESSPGRLFIGHVDGVAVATSLAFFGGGAIGIYGVGTVPDHRGRGYGGAMTMAAATWGRDQGADFAVLAASEAGFPVYERLGFRTVCQVTSWVRPSDSTTAPA